MDNITRDLAAKSKHAMCRFHHEFSDKLGPLDDTLAYSDLFIAGALRRSYSLTRGFFDLILSSNFSAAAPLIRLQLDNVLRTAAIAWAKNPQNLFDGLLEGKSINKMVASDGNLMTDRYLCNRFSSYEPWISELYKETSAFIHLSDKHMLAALAPGMKYEDFKCVLEDEEAGVPETAYQDAVISFVRITTIFLDLVDLYIEQKYRENRACSHD